MDQLSIIKRPIKADLERFVNLFEKSLTHDYGLLAQVLDHIRQRSGKRMRPMLSILVVSLMLLNMLLLVLNFYIQQALCMMMLSMIVLNAEDSHR